MKEILKKLKLNQIGGISTKTKIGTAIGSILMVLMMLVSVYSLTQVTTTNTNKSFGFRSLVRTSTGILYAVTFDETDNGLEIWKSSDGTSWAEQDTSNNPDGYVTRSSIAIDSSDILHIAYGWFDDSGGPDDVEVRYITFDTADGGAQDDAFNSPEIAVDFGTDGDTSIFTSIALDSNDKPHISFSNKSNFSGTSYNTVYYINKIGGSWTSKLEVEGGSNQVACSLNSIAMNSSNIPLIGIYEGTNDTIITAKGNQNNATSFTLKTVDSTVNLNEFTPVMFVDSDDNTWVTYRDADNTANVAKQSVNWTDDWEIHENEGTTNSSFSGVAIGTDIYLIYTERITDDVYYRKYDGSWDSNVFLHGDDSNSYSIVNAKWSYYNDNQRTTQIDYIVHETVGDQIHWDKIVLAPSLPANIPPDLNIWQVDGYDFNATVLPSFDFATDGNLTITFRAEDRNADDILFTMWYDTTRGGTANNIVTDANLSDDFCDTSEKTGMACTWDWDIDGVADNNYWITIELDDGTDTNTMTALQSFLVNPSEEDVCDCPAAGGWNIYGGNKCTLQGACSLQAGDLHISNGSLNITSTGTLTIETGYNIILANGGNASLYIEDGGQIIIEA